MLLIDTHTHLYSSEFDADRIEMVQRAIEAGVQKMYLPNVDSHSIEGMLALETAFPNNCYPMMGLHPCSVKENVEYEIDVIKSWLQKRQFVGVGEIGIDLYWDKTFVEQQIWAFKVQTEWAKDLKLPIIIHSRESTDECIQVVKEAQDGNLRGIFHCFGGTVEQAKEIIDLGFLLGIGGVLTFKKAGLDIVLKEIPLENIVLETDAPYLAPVPYRGKRNESAYIKLIAEKLADIKEVSVEEIAQMTTQNALQLFHNKQVANFV